MVESWRFRKLSPGQVPGDRREERPFISSKYRRQTHTFEGQGRPEGQQGEWVVQKASMGNSGSSWQGRGTVIARGG